MMPPKTTPIRTALIGLSSSATTSWASSAHLPGLLTPNARSKIQISALLNSSVEAAESAIKTYNLGPDTKAYGSPVDLANDPDIDLVICNTRVDIHYETILPSVKNGKDVYVEWPIASNLEHVNVLAEEAKKSGSRIAVGLQRRWTPVVVKVKELLSEGKLGTVLSSDVQAFGGTVDREVLPESLKYFSQREVGGNPIVIGFGHMFDYILTTLGDLDPATVSTQLQLQRPSIRIRNTSTKEIIEKTQSNVPDLLTLHGTTIHPSPATVSITYRRGQPFPGTPSFSWTINCEHGEIRIVSPPTITLETTNEGNDAVKIYVHWFEDDSVQEVNWNWSEEQQQVPVMARSVMSCLVAFAEGKKEGDGWVSIEDAARRAEMIEGFLKGWEDSQK